MRNKHLYITLLAVLGFYTEMAGQDAARQAPRLVVNVMIDQLRSDYLEAFVPLYGENGFKRLLTQGAVYENASYPFAPTDRASAISSVMTGTTPYYHGIIGRQWLNRETLRPINCTDDPKQLGTPVPTQLATSTIGDELKVATDGKAKIFSIAPYCDAAILAAGHAADGAIWEDETSGRWTSSSYYSNESPNWLLSFNELKRPKRRIRSKKNAVKPSKNDDITALASLCVEQQALGDDEVTDLLCLTYHVGQSTSATMAEYRQEIQDTYVRLDQNLDSLLSRIERKIGADRVLFMVTGTGYSDEPSIDYSKYRIPTGTFYINRTANLLNMYLGALWGQARYVEAYFGNQIFFNHQLLESKRITLTEISQRAQEFISQMAGVRNTYTGMQLLSGTNEQTARLRNGFSLERSGDILVEVAPGWHICNEDTPQADYLSQLSATPFPIILYGVNVEARRVSTPVTIDRIAPTLARSIRIRAPNACPSEPLF